MISLIKQFGMLFFVGLSTLVSRLVSNPLEYSFDYTSWTSVYCWLMKCILITCSLKKNMLFMVLGSNEIVVNHTDGLKQ